MKKLIISIAITLFAMSAMAGRILWLGIDKNTPVNFSNGTSIGLNQLDYDTQVNTFKAAVYDSSASQVLAYLDLYYEEEYERELTDGTFVTEKRWVKEDGFNEGDLMFVDQGGQTYLGTNWQPAAIPDWVSDTMKLCIELGFLDMSSWTDDPSTWVGDVQLFAKSDFVSFGELGEHSYISETLAPPTETPWKPSYFAVPEPSTAILALLGVGMLFKRRQ